MKPLPTSQKVKPLSWSELDIFIKDEAEWYRRYVEGIKPPPTPAMQRGVDLHALCLEEGTNALNPDKYFANELRINKKIKEAFTKHVQIPFAPEQKRTVDIDGVPFTGVWDGLADKTILELKTGKALWTEDRVTTHGQLYCYAAQHLISEGVIPEVILITANTQNGSVKTFNLTPSESDVADAIKIIKNVWSDMGPLIHKRIASK